MALPSRLSQDIFSRKDLGFFIATGMWFGLQKLMLWLPVSFVVPSSTLMFVWDVGIEEPPVFPGGSVVKNPPANAGDMEDQVREESSEKETATHSSILAWKILWTEEPGRLQPMGLQKSRTPLSDWAHDKHWDWRARWCFRSLGDAFHNYAGTSLLYIIDVFRKVAGTWPFYELKFCFPIDVCFRGDILNCC